MFVAAASESFPHLSFHEMLDRLVDLEYGALDLAVHESGGHLRPSEVHADLSRAVHLCRATQRITPCALSVDIHAEGDDYYHQFASCCKLAKAVKIVTVTVPASELGTPFNAEIERLRSLVGIASLEGVLVGVKIQTGRVTQDPDTTVVMCKNVKGLGVTLDPSHLIFGPHQGGSYEQIMNYVYHVHLRDTTKQQFQVRVGQGEVEYSRLIGQLARVKYDRALSVNMPPMPGIEHSGEMRKMRLLLESLL
ncbi:MAG: xylose isomerase [Planctomycetes bacterium RBG_16_64_10]|nr:MAG: xylose isomerase [Planctomycetes bacterium RBG_16_64_10]